MQEILLKIGYLERRLSNTFKKVNFISSFEPKVEVKVMDSSGSSGHKLSLTDKSCVREQINLVEKGKILKTDSETSRSFKYFLWKQVKNLEMNQY